MPVARPEANTQQLPPVLAVALGHADGGVLVRPVFVDEAGRRKRVLLGAAWVAATLCVAYLVVVGVSLNAGPSGPLTGLAEPLVGLTAPRILTSPAPAASPAVRPRDAAVARAEPGTGAPLRTTADLDPPAPTRPTVRAAPVVLPTHPRTDTDDTSKPARPTSATARPPVGPTAAPTAAPTLSVVPTVARTVSAHAPGLDV